MSNKLYIGNLPFKLNEKELQTLFENTGNVVSVKIPTDRDTGKPRGFAFIEMNNKDEALEAIFQLNGIQFGGRNIKVSLAVERSNSFSKSSTPRTYSNKPYAKYIGTGVCILCNSTTTLYGFNPTQGVCADCISSLSKASKSNSYKHSY